MIALAVWWLVRHPRLLAVLLGLLAVGGWSVWRLGLSTAVHFWLLVGVALWVWRCLHPSSFEPVAGRWLRSAWRWGWVYGRHWTAALHMADLADYYAGGWYVPSLRWVRSNGYMDRLTVRMLKGQHPSDFQARADTLAHTFGQLACRARVARPGVIHLDFTRRDALADTIAALPVADLPDLRALPVGLREDGRIWLLRLIGCHVLIAGATGAGKGSVLQSLLRALGPHIRSGLVHLFGIDPKGGMELTAAGAGVLYRRLATDDPEEWAELLEFLVAMMRTRARRLAGHTRLHEPSVDDPLVLLVIDELASLTAYKPRAREARDLYGRIEANLNLLLSQGRAVGVIVVAALQDPRKEVIPSRDLFPVRIALRLDEEEATKMVLGPNARDRGADCTLISLGTPGVAWVWCDGEAEPSRVRAAYPTDDDIRAFVEQYRPRQRGAIDANVIDLGPREGAA